MAQNQNWNTRRLRMAEGHHPPPPPTQKCPRCESLNTKFCYYNNYSYSQPRYFCKGCRRHWTHGGTLRNVPVGGGCRKMKRPRTEDVRTFAHAGPAQSFSALRNPQAIIGAQYGGSGLGFIPSSTAVNEIGVNLPAHNHCQGQNDYYLTQQNFTFPARPLSLNSWTQSFLARNTAMAGSTTTAGSGFWTGGENPAMGYSFNPNQWPGFDPSA